MAIFSRLIFAAVKWRARRGLSSDQEIAADKKETALRRGMRGETFAYWYLRRQGYVFVARNFVPRGAKGGIGLVGYDGETFAVGESRTRTAREVRSALPGLEVPAGGA